MTPQRALEWQDGTWMAADQYSCGDVCLGLYRGCPDGVRQQRLAIARAQV